jgi:hypothetical protein
MLSWKFHYWNICTAIKFIPWRMPSSGMLCCVAPVRTNILEECIVFLRSMLWLLVTANVVPSSPIPVTLMLEVICSYEMSVLTRDINISAESIPHSHCHENLKSYKFIPCSKCRQRQNFSIVLAWKTLALRTWRSFLL